LEVPVVDADAFNAFEAAGWETHAAGYDEFFGPITTQLVEPLLDAADVHRGARVLDVASGPGYVAARAAQRGASVVGVDIAEAMISLARRLHPQLEFRHGSAETLPVPDESFDAAVGNFVVLHLARPEQAAASSLASSSPAAGLRSPSGTFPTEHGSSACSSRRWQRQEPVRLRISLSGRRSSGSRRSRSSSASCVIRGSRASR
jgi:SAM-dependent methyltransferase